MALITTTFPIPLFFTCTTCARVPTLLQHLILLGLAGHTLWAHIVTTSFNVYPLQNPPRFYWMPYRARVSERLRFKNDTF